MEKRAALIALILAFAMLACACAPGVDKEQTPNPDLDPETKGEQEEKEYQAKLDVIEPSAYGNGAGLHLEEGSYISIIGEGDSGPYWEAVKQGVKQAEEDINAFLGYEGEEKIEAAYSGPSETGSVDEQVNILDEELARYPVALGISIADVQSCTVQFDLAAESGIPIVAFDSGSDYQGLMAMVSTDNQASAREAAERMGELVDGGGEVAVFVHDSQSKSAVERMDSFIETLNERYPGITVAEIYYLDQPEEMEEQITAEIEESAETEPEQGGESEEEMTEEQIVDAIFEKYPDLKGCYATSGEAVHLALGAIERSGRENVRLVGYDVDEEIIEALVDEKIDGIMLQNPFGMGYAAVIASARAALSMGNEAYVDTGYVWVTGSNLERESIQKMLY